MRWILAPGAPTPPLGWWYPPSQASWPNEFDHLSKKIFLSENVSNAVACYACYI